MLSTIINKLVGRRNTVECEVTVTTYFSEYGATKSGADRGMVGLPPKLIFTNV